MKISFYRRLILLLSILFIAGCQATTGYYKGALADQETIVAFTKDEGNQQHWRDLYVSVDYSFRTQGDQLVCEGVFAFSDYPQGMLARVRDFKLKVFLLDQHDRVLDYFELYRAVSSDLGFRAPFRKVFALPAGAVAASFGYEGIFIGEYDAGETVWKLPKRAR